jgi:ABC-type multidrug transport system fused ATPase/permease subunit
LGTHAELMERRGFYFDMVERQWRAFADDAAA